MAVGGSGAGLNSAGFISPAIDAIAGALAASQVAHFDETGFRVAGKLAWVHPASAGKHVLVTVHAKRGKDGMGAAGILPAFAGIAVAWRVAMASSTRPMPKGNVYALQA